MQKFWLVIVVCLGLFIFNAPVFGGDLEEVGPAQNDQRHFHAFVMHVNGCIVCWDLSELALSDEVEKL